VRADVAYVDTMGVRFGCEGTAVAAKPPAYGREPGILGMPFLARGRLTYDYAAKRVWAQWRPNRTGGRRASPETSPIRAVTP
jgi:hypothetical protein